MQSDTFFPIYQRTMTRTHTRTRTHTTHAHVHAHTHTTHAHVHAHTHTTQNCLQSRIALKVSILTQSALLEKHFSLLRIVYGRAEIERLSEIPDNQPHRSTCIAYGAITHGAFQEHGLTSQELPQVLTNYYRDSIRTTLLPKLIDSIRTTLLPNYLIGRMILRGVCLPPCSSWRFKHRKSRVVGRRTIIIQSITTGDKTDLINSYSQGALLLHFPRRH